MRFYEGSKRVMMFNQYSEIGDVGTKNYPEN